MRMIATFLAAAAIAGLAAVIGLVWLPGGSASADPGAAPSPVTLEQVESAIATSLSCAEERGLIAQPVPGEGLRLTKGLVSTPPLRDGETAAAAVASAQAIMQGCRASSGLDDLSATYRSELYGNVDRAQVEADYGWMAECIETRAAGQGGTSRGLLYIRYANGLDEGLSLPASEPGVHEACAWKFEAETGRGAPPPP